MFKVDGPFSNILSKFFDMILISVIWVICCIPVITIGAATTAMYYSVVKVIRRDRGYLTKEYIKSFKENFKPATIVWVILGVLGCLFYFVAQFRDRLEPNIGNIIYYAMILFGVILMFITLYSFPVLSRFQMTPVQVISSGLAMSFKHLVSTIMISIIFISGVFIATILPAALMFIPGLVVFGMSLFLERVLKIYTPVAEVSEDEDAPKKDEWYLE